MRIGIIGYGNLGRSLEMLAEREEEIEIVGVFTRRDPTKVKTSSAKVLPFSALEDYKEQIDVLCLCHGSSHDLPTLAPTLAKQFNTVDTFDNHKQIEKYKLRMNTSAKASSHTSLVSLGWDPGFLSLIRLYASAFLPSSSVNTFWGRGVSQGHSEAIRRIDGVRRAVQYTVPREDAITLASLVSHPFSDTDRHRRVCYVVAEKEKEDLIKSEILSMKNYFAGYQTEVRFVSDEEFEKYHTSPSHRGRIYALGTSGRYREVKHSLYLDLDIGSNPDLTASIMLSGALAVYKLYNEGRFGAYSVFDISPSYFCPIKGKTANQFL